MLGPIQHSIQLPKNKLYQTKLDLLYSLIVAVLYQDSKARNMSRLRNEPVQQITCSSTRWCESRSVVTMYSKCYCWESDAVTGILIAQHHFFLFQICHPCTSVLCTSHISTLVLFQTFALLSLHISLLTCGCLLYLSQST